MKYGNCSNCGSPVHMDGARVLRHEPSPEITNGSIFCDPSQEGSTVATIRRITRTEAHEQAEANRYFASKGF